jgi:hypothetical protein
MESFTYKDSEKSRTGTEEANTNKLGLSKDVGTRGPGKITLGGRVNDF